MGFNYTYNDSRLYSYFVEFHYKSLSLNGLPRRYQRRVGIKP